MGSRFRGNDGSNARERRLSVNAGRTEVIRRTVMGETQASRNGSVQTERKRVFSGIQPSGELHLGNYLGAMKGWAERQHEKENFFCIVDLHAITVPQDPDTLRRRTRSVAAMLLATGLSPDRCTLFVQSHVKAHAEGCWLLNCITPVGWLERMTQFKDKSTGDERVSTGLLDYPVLMTADIILYDAHEVPVGDDQRQHVELARDIAERFNRLFGDTFVVPEAVIPEVGARVMGLNDPAVKMAKTHSDVRGHAVALLDDAKEIERTFKRAVTDSGNEIAFSDDPARAGVNNLLGIYKAVTGRSNDEVERDFAGRPRLRRPEVAGRGGRHRGAAPGAGALPPADRRRGRAGRADGARCGAGRGRERPEDRRGEGAHRPGAAREGRGMSDGATYHPTLDEMRRLAGSGNMAPVYREMRADIETPVSAYLKVARPPYSFLLESVEGGESVARYSFIGTEPYDVIRTGPGEKFGATDPLVHVERELAGRAAVGLPAGPEVQRRRGRLHVVRGRQATSSGCPARMPTRWACPSRSS